MIPPRKPLEKYFYKDRSIKRRCFHHFYQQRFGIFFSFRNNLEGVYEIISFCGGGGAYIIRWTIQLHIFIFVLFE